MNKTELKAKWGKYCDTSSLVDNMASLLSGYGHRSSKEGICAVLDRYFTNKEPLIKLFATSNHYIGEMRIAIKKEFDRDIDRYKVSEFCRRFPTNIGAESILLQYKDADGHVVSDYLTTGCEKINIKTYVESEERKAKVKNLNNFDLKSGATVTSHAKYGHFLSYAEYFARSANSKVCGNVSSDGLELKDGTKMSRAFNKMCVHYGIDKADGYDKLFAQYADLVTCATRQLYFVISVNPLDYLTMSIGESWTSCHSINGRNGFGGMACGGCMSYLLDNTSIITYVVKNLDAPIHKSGKIYRQMYHYGNDLLIQSRLYPQGNDGATNLYQKFRSFMQEEFSELMGLDSNKWTDMVGGGIPNNFGRHIGHQYNDFSHRECSVFYPTEMEKRFNVTRMDGKRITIGHESICPCCGKRQETRSRISHESCHF
jgi:hypothetical protein